MKSPTSLASPSAKPRSELSDREAIAARLASMTPRERLCAARRGEFSRAERALWAAKYPDEIPLVNGEFEWIALTLADLD